MYEDIMKMAQESMKPMLKMVESNTALAVKLMQAQADTGIVFGAISRRKEPN